MAGKLYVVGTPIGNLSDMSPRALKTLEEVDFIAAEDTRVSRKLLTHFGIQKPMVSYHKFSGTKRGEDIVFLRRIIPGGVDESYGIEVSKLAGIPRWVIDRAYEVLSSLEEGREVSRAKVHTRAKAPEGGEQLFFIDEKGEAIKKRLRQADPNTLTPLEALNLIYELKKLL